MKKIDNASTAKSNATRGSVYTIHNYKYIKYKSITTRVTDKYENAYLQAFAIESSRK